MPIGSGLTSMRVEYRDFDWVAASDGTLKIVGIEAVPILDEAKRTITAVTHTVTLKATIFGNGSTSDNNLDSIRVKLLEPGGRFYFENTGFASLSVNAAIGGPADVKWGPMPLLVSWVPHGLNAADVIWKVAVCIPSCTGAAYTNALMEFNYSIEFDRDRAGYTTRTYEGYFAIPQTRGVGEVRQLADTADFYWGQVLPEALPNFRREVNRAKLDYSKCRCDFTIVDTEIGPNALPEGVVDCDFSHDVQSKTGLCQFTVIFRAEYEMVKGYNGEAAAQHFKKLVIQRRDAGLAFAGNPVKGIDAKQIAGPGEKPSWLILAFNAGERDIFKRPKATFELICLLNNVRLETIIGQSGLYLLTETTWDKWQDSVKDTIFAPRGTAGLVFNPADDSIIDLCLGVTTATMRVDADPGDRQLKNVDDDELIGELPDPEDSWIDYQYSMRVETDDDVVLLKPLPTDDGDDGTDDDTVDTAGFAPDVATDDDMVQRRASSYDSVIVTGWAARIGYDIALPKLLTIGGRPCIMANRLGMEFFETFVIGYFGHTVMGAVWQTRYLVPSTPEDEPLYNVGLSAQGTPTAPRVDDEEAFPVEDIDNPPVDDAEEF